SPCISPLSLHDALPIWFDPHTVIADPELDVLALQAGGDRHPPGTGPSLNAVAHGVFHQGLDRHGRYDRAARSFRHLDGHVEIPRSEEHTSELQSLAYLV